MYPESASAYAEPQHSEIITMAALCLLTYIVHYIRHRT